MKTKTIAIALLAVLLTVFTVPVYASDNIPPLPHAFYGTVEVNGDPAPAGTEVEARGEGILTNVGNNPFIVTVEGSYGSSHPLEPKLVVQGDDASDGTGLTFYVNGVSTGQIAEWHSGEVTELSLTVAIEGPPPGTTDVSDIISDTGVFINRVEAGSSDDLCWLIIDSDTVGLTRDGAALTEIKVIKMGAPPALPTGASAVGSVYDFKPDGATFNPAISLEYTYDPAKIPGGVAEEELVLAWWDSSVSGWVELESTINPETNMITAPTTHFSSFAILAYEPPTIPAMFNLSSLAISPDEIAAGESVTISVQLANTGGETGSYEATLKIDNVVEASKQVVVNAGASQGITFTAMKDSAGTYTVDVNGLSSTFVVTGEAQAPDKSVVSSPAPSASKPSPPAPPLPPSPSTPPASPIDWPALLIVIAGVSAMGMMIPLLARRKKHARYWKGPGPWDK